MRYEMRGSVSDQFTDDGIGGGRVEAWDKDFGIVDYLDAATTISDGCFRSASTPAPFAIASSTAYSSPSRPDNWPDLYFKVYCYNELLHRPSMRYYGTSRHRRLASKSRRVIRNRRYAMSGASTSRSSASRTTAP